MRAVVREARDVDVVVVDLLVRPHHRARLQVVEPHGVAVARHEHQLVRTVPVHRRQVVELWSGIWIWIWMGRGSQEDESDQLVESIINRIQASPPLATTTHVVILPHDPARRQPAAATAASALARPVDAVHLAQVQRA